MLKRMVVSERAPVSMVDETKSRNPIHLTFAASFVQHIVGRCYGEKLALSVD